MTKQPQTTTPASGIAQPESLEIDPVAMNIVNRIAPGTVQTGELVCEGGLLVEGKLSGKVTVTGGPLVLLTHGVISGDVVVNHDAYLLGTFEEKPDGQLCELSVTGTAFLGSTLKAAANLQASALKTYHGAHTFGLIRIGPFAAPEQAS